MSNVPNPTPEVQLVKSTMSPGDWAKVINQVVLTLIAAGGLTALIGIKSSTDKPLPVVPVDPTTVVAPGPVNPNVPAPKPVVYVTKDEVTKIISDSEERIIKALDDRLKAFEE